MWHVVCRGPGPDPVGHKESWKAVEQETQGPGVPCLRVELEILI